MFYCKKIINNKKRKFKCKKKLEKFEKACWSSCPLATRIQTHHCSVQLSLVAQQFTAIVINNPQEEDSKTHFIRIRSSLFRRKQERLFRLHKIHFFLSLFELNFTQIFCYYSLN